MELEAPCTNEMTKNKCFSWNHILIFMGSKKTIPVLTGETRNHFRYQTFRFFGRFYWHAFTHRAALSGFLTLLDQKKTEPAAGGGVPWSFLFSLDGF